jgi:hypothetical protein
MDDSRLQKYIYRGRIIFLTGILMLFEKIEYSLHVGILMMIIGFLVIRYFQNKVNFEKNKRIIIKHFNEQIVEKPQVIKEMNIISTFKKIYELNNNNITININIINIDNNIINNNNIIYDDITLFLDIYMFVKKFELIQSINKKFLDNKLLFDYYKYYYIIISYISNMDDDNLISIAISHLVEDYNNNKKQLYKLINNVLISNNKEDWITNNNIKQNVIKYILIIFNNIIYENLSNEFYLT